MYNNEYLDEARKLFLEGEKLFQELDPESKSAEPELLEIRKALSTAFLIPIP